MRLLFLLLVAIATRVGGNNVGESSVTYTIPKHLQPDNKLLRNFKVLSTHGRNDLSSDNDKTQRADTDKSTIDSSNHKMFKIVMRAMYLFWIFFPTVITSQFAYFSTSFCEYVWYPLLSRSLAYGGAAFIKWGQWASTRPDVFPQALCSCLEHLQSKAPEHSFAFTRWQIETELGAPVEAILEHIDTRPIASGSIAQVYRARMNGVDVAVKVRHPNVKEQIELDFILMKAFARFIESLPGFSWLNLAESMAQFSETISAQTSLDIEGKHLVLFNRHFKRWSDTAFPRPYVLTESVLIESFEKGLSVATYADNAKRKGGGGAVMASDIAHFIVCRGEDIYLKMLLQDNLMHADLHPGNILVQEGGGGDKVAAIDDKSIRKIVLVDAGMVAELLPSEQRNFIGLLGAMGNGNGVAAAECVLHFSSLYSAYTPETKTAFKFDMAELFASVCKGYGHNVNIGDVLRGVLNLARIHRITIESNYATLVMNAMCLDGLAGMLLPSYNILDGAKPLLRLNGICSRAPSFLSKICMRITIPVALRIKRLKDRRIIKSLLNDEEREERKG